MRRWLWIVAVLVVVGGALVHTSRGQFQTGKPPVEGPGDGGATLRLPGAEPSRPSSPGGAPLPYYLQNAPATAAYPTMKPGGGKVALPP